MTHKQLAALDTYRKHKHCNCPDCYMAKALLSGQIPIPKWTQNEKVTKGAK